VIAGGEAAGANLAVGGEMADDRGAGRNGRGVEEGRVRVGRLRHDAMISTDLSPPDVDRWPHDPAVRLVKIRSSVKHLFHKCSLEYRVWIPPSGAAWNRGFGRRLQA